VKTTDAALLERFEDCCRRAGIRRQPALLISSAVRIPATAGLWRRRILLPPGLFDRLTDREQRSVLLHELAHVRCRDVASNWVLALVQILHWFNPAIRLAIGRLKVDREMARDAMVLRWMTGGDAALCREQYARTLLNLTESLSTGPRCLAMAAGLAGICTPAAAFTAGRFGRGSALKRRLKMIRRSATDAKRSMLVGSLLIAALVCCTLTRAQSRPEAPAPGGPNPTSSVERKTADGSTLEDLEAEARDLINKGRFDEALTIVEFTPEIGTTNMPSTRGLTYSTKLRLRKNFGANRMRRFKGSLIWFFPKLVSTPSACRM
jgi:hypothetical protein